jgi:hypothetical protein
MSSEITNNILEKTILFMEMVDNRSWDGKKKKNFVMQNIHDMYDSLDDPHILSVIDVIPLLIDVIVGVSKKQIVINKNQRRKRMSRLFKSCFTK